MDCGPWTFDDRRRSDCLHCLSLHRRREDKSRTLRRRITSPFHGVSLSRHSSPSDYDGKSVDVGAVVEAAAVRVDDVVAVMGVVVGRRGGGGGARLMLRLMLWLLLLEVMPTLLLVRVVGGRHRVARLPAAAGVRLGRGHSDVLDGVGHGPVGSGGGGGCVRGA